MIDRSVPVPVPALIDPRMRPVTNREHHRGTGGLYPWALLGGSRGSASAEVWMSCPRVRECRSML
jgi:hypothetical protein